MQGVKGQVRALLAAGAVAIELAHGGMAYAVQANGDQRIEAVTEFLIDRGKENAFYIFEQRIARDETLECYFPNVFRYVRQGDLRIFLKSRTLWKESLEKDMKVLLTRVALKAAQSANLQQIAKQGSQQEAAYDQYLLVSYNGRNYRLSAANDQSLAQDVRDYVAGFSSGPSAARIYLNDLGATVGAAQRLTGKNCGIPDLDQGQITNLTQRAKDTVAALTTWEKYVGDHSGSLRIDVDKVAALCKVDPSQKICAARTEQIAGWFLRVNQVTTDVVRTVNAVGLKLQQYEANWNSTGKETERVLLAIQLLVDMDPEGREEIVLSLKRHVLFFAEVSDAQTAPEIKALLEEYTLPAVSFGVKRERFKGHALISAFLGYAYGKVLNASDPAGNRNKQGIYAPIGLDLSLGTQWGGSASLLLAPVDFGYPVSLKLNGVTEGASLSDVIAPSLALSYGLSRLPMTFGVVYQSGRKDPANDRAERRLMLFMGLDMPLLTLF